MIFSKSHLCFSTAVFCGLALPLTAQTLQEKCGTVRYENIRRQRNPKLEGTDQFEEWMREKISNLKTKTLNNGRTQGTTYIIPVVVHIIYNQGDSLSVATGGPTTGTYISDAQVQSQIDILNKDYPRLNADTVNTPSEFKPAAGKIDMQFVLAKQDPEGLPTSGILRVRGTKTSWTLDDNSIFKALSYWPAENYLNIWIVKFNDPQGIIGYAQLPVSSLPGLEDASNDRTTDGVAIDYRAFGIGNPELYSQFDKGRTATHEIGHIFGLRHIWGDVNSCTGTDYCNDTPSQLGSTSNCPSQPALSCSHDKMFQNYMDYTDDVCMNIFTNDQIARMVVVLGSSPRRASLLTSPGATDPVAVANDLGIKRVVSPGSTSCPSLIPQIVVRNYGTNDVTGAQIQLTVNGNIVEAINPDWSSAPLHPLDSTIVSFTSVNLAYASTNTFDFLILQTNGLTDGKATNNSQNNSVGIPYQSGLPLYEPFNASPSTWQIFNPDSLTTWQNVTAPNSSASNKAMYMNFYNYDAINESDWLVSPVFNLSTDTAALLRFDRAYATISTSYNDRLRVLVSTSCDFSNAVEIFNKAGTTLSTAANTSSAFAPKSQSDWKSETLSLTQFLGQPNVQIAFVATNDFGNNLYLDNVRVIIGNYTDLTLEAVKRPSPVTCVDHPTPVITVKNNGSTLITNFTVSVQINGGTATQDSFSGGQLDTGEEQDFILQPWTLQNDTNIVVVTVQNPNEQVPADNTVSLTEVVNTAESIVPLRENFNTSFPDWTIVSETNQPRWESIKTNKSISLVYDAYSNLAIGNKSWLVSPTLDLSRVGKASMFFDLSYAKSSAGSERLQVLLSKDCGQTFPTIIFDQTGDQFADGTSGISWAPTQDADWKRIYVNLDSLAGVPQSRIGFVVTNDHGNNLYIDNVEIYTDDNQSPVAINTLFSVYDNFPGKTDDTFKLTFNLPEAEEVTLQIFNTLGQVIISNLLPNTLNQTYTVDLNGQQPGIYLVRLQMGDHVGTAKVLVQY